MPEMRIVTYQLEVSCNGCEWSTEARMTRREASVGRPSISQISPEMKRSVGQEYHTCPECGGSDLGLGTPEIVEETDLSADLESTSVNPSN